MAPRQSSKSLVRRSQTALTVGVAPMSVSRETAALVSERNFFRNKTRLLEHDIAQLRQSSSLESHSSGRSAIAAANAPAPEPATPAQGRARNATPAEIEAALVTQAAGHAAVLQRQAILQQLAMAGAEVRFARESERANALHDKLDKLQKLQRSPPYRIAKYLSRRGRDLKRLIRRLSGKTR